MEEYCIGRQGPQRTVALEEEEEGKGRRKRSINMN
jgi:hypothetical protein